MAERAGPYRDFSDMPNDKLRSLANALSAIARGEKLKDVLRRARAANERGE